MAEVIIDRERCKGCLLCASFCPKQLFTLSDKFNSSGYYPVEIKEMKECSGCAVCATVCPDVAITAVDR
jgi:2-oxoglutarate ferredoxin oxidoreductase subunit delta